jgi:uncharacterized membrane protein
MTLSRPWAIGLGLLLVLSLGLNLFIGGLIAGARAHRGPDMAAMQAENRALFARLSDADRAVAREIVRDRLRLTRSFGGDYRQAMREAETALRAQPFDAARYRTALDAIRGLNDRRTEQEFDGLVEAAQRFTPEGRALIAEMRRPGLRALLPPEGRGDGPRDGARDGRPGRDEGDERGPPPPPAP